jgi:hypothetical protein
VRVEPVPCVAGHDGVDTGTWQGNRRGRTHERLHPRKARPELIEHPAVRFDGHDTEAAGCQLAGCLPGPGPKVKHALLGPS